MKKAIIKYLLIGSVCVLFAVLGMVTYKKSQENKIVFTISDKICVSYGDNIDISNMKAPAFKMVLTGVGKYAYNQDGVFIIPIGCLGV